MRDLTNEILELIRRTSSSLPKDVEERLWTSIEKEESGSAARSALETILKNIELSRANSTLICQVKSFSVVTMESHGQSKHSLLDESSHKILEDLLARP
jgi:tartrate dehydratase alpha subunit/fumarate hydratase class I-like protein